MSSSIESSILLICPLFFGYDKSIRKELEGRGYIVDVYNADPGGVQGTFISTLRTFHIGAKKVIRWFENRLLNKLNKKYDIVIVVCGWAITSYSVKNIRNNNLKPSGKMLLYYWDSLELLKDDITRWPFFDKIYTFDRNDYENHRDIFDFLPLFYCNQYLELKEKAHLYNLATIGSYKYDRYFLIEDLKTRNEEITIVSYMYSPKWEILFHKAFRKKYKDIKLENLSFKKLSFGEIIGMYEETDAVLDIPRTGQNGLTMRTIECLAMKKKVITTNPNVINYDFYNPSNIYIMDSNTLELPNKQWFTLPYCEIDSKIVDNYSITNWVNILLKD